jgi:carboxylesterase type B
MLAEVQRLHRSLINNGRDVTLLQAVFELKVVISNKNVSGAHHGSDLGYLFETSFNEKLNLDPDDEGMKLSSKMLKMWINFAKTGYVCNQIL